MLVPCGRRTDAASAGGGSRTRCLGGVGSARNASKNTTWSTRLPCAEYGSSVILHEGDHPIEVAVFDPTTSVPTSGIYPRGKRPGPGLSVGIVLGLSCYDENFFPT